MLNPPISPLSADILPLISAVLNRAADAVSCPVEPVMESWLESERIPTPSIVIPPKDPFVAVISPVILAADAVILPEELNIKFSSVLTIAMGSITNPAIEAD